jgi:hypothetical protein
MKSFLNYITEIIGEANEAKFFSYEKGWYNPALSQYIPVSPMLGYRYHITALVKNLSKFGITKAKMNSLIRTETGFTDKVDIDNYLKALDNGSLDVFFPAERVANEKGWVRVVLSNRSGGTTKVFLSSSSIPYLKRAAGDLLPYWDKRVDAIGIDIEPTDDGKQNRGYLNLDSLREAERFSKR